MADTTRASTPRPTPAAGKAAGGGDKKFLGQPVWLWVVGAVVVVGGYLYLKSKSSQQQAAANKNTGHSSSGGGGGGGGGGYASPAPWTTETFKTWTRDHNNHPRRAHPGTGAG